MKRAIRQRLFAAVIGAVLGTALGRAVEPLAQGPTGQERFRSQVYQHLYRAYPRIGAGLGALIGTGFALIAQAQRSRFRDPGASASRSRPGRRRGGWR
jgi:hypothetical protein